MDNYKVKFFSLKNDRYIDEIPQSLSNYLSEYAMKKSFGIEIYYKNQLAFVCRFYYLTNTYKVERGFPVIAQYEIGDIYLFPDFRGKKDKILDEKFSIICLASALFMIPNIILWTTEDNIPALKLYERIGFKYIKVLDKTKRWIYNIFGKDNPWIKNKDLVFMFKR